MTAGITPRDQYMLGALGETEVATRYKQAGYIIVARNYRCRDGEIDIIAMATDGTTVFVEVKTRRGTCFGGAESVTARKLARMRKAAVHWLRDKPFRQVRFDVVEVLFDGHDCHTRLYQGVDDGSC